MQRIGARLEGRPRRWSEPDAGQRHRCATAGRPARIDARRARLACLALLILLSGCGSDGISFLHPHGMVADAQRHWLLYVTAWMMIIILPVFILVPFVAWRYRRGSTAAYRPTWEFSWPLELAVWGLPVVVVVFLAFLIIAKETPLGPYRPIPGQGAPMVVDVVALDWKWLFVYPEQHIATVGVLAMPLNRQVDFRLTSDATMQSFFIPSLGSQIYAMAGMVTQLHLVANRTGTLMGENTQFNGMHFQDDKFDVQVMPQTSFDAWVAEQQSAGRTLDPTTYGQLVQHDTTSDAKKRFSVPASSTLSFTLGSQDFFSSVVGKYNPGAMQSMRSGSM